MLLSTSGTRTTLLPHTRDAAPVKSKVALRLTAAQGVDYYSMEHTDPTSLHQEGHHRHMNHHMVVDTLYIIITMPRSHYIYTTVLAIGSNSLLPFGLLLVGHSGHWCGCSKSWGVLMPLSQWGLLPKGKLQKTWLSMSSISSRAYFATHTNKYNC